jgi:DNA-binding response OmpR family regulator
MSKENILLVEDDPNLGQVIKDHLEFRGYLTVLCRDGESAWNTFLASPFDLCVVDIMMPKKNGLELVKSIRERDGHVPLLFISARTLDEDKILGLQTGADDYILKPFRMEELVLRMEVFLRRSQNQKWTPEPLGIGEYHLDPHNHMLLHPKGNQTLTKKETEILLYFCRHKDQVVKREDILTLVWGEDDYFMGRSLDVYISRIRKYLQHDKRVEIQTIFAVGFKLQVREVQM